MKNIYLFNEGYGLEKMVLGGKEMCIRDSH